MKYKTLLFDVDDTLLDFQAAEQKALHALFRNEGFVLTEEMEATYKTINGQLWRRFELGEIDKATVTDTRFSRLFETYGKSVDGKKMGELYREFLAQGHDLLGNSQAIIAELATTYELYIVTNGVAKTQYQRLDRAQLTPFFKQIFVSEEIGYQKPMRAYFDYVFARIPQFELSKTMIIGDSLASDIQGGNQAGIDTVWLNPAKTDNRSMIQPTYEIDQLEKLIPLLK